MRIGTIPNWQRQVEEARQRLFPHKDPERAAIMLAAKGIVILYDKKGTKDEPRDKSLFQDRRTAEE